MARKKCNHIWGRWVELKDEKGKKYRKQCLLCNRVYTIRKPTVQAVHDAIGRQTGIIPK